MSRRIAAAMAVPALAGAAALGAVALIADSERDAAEEARDAAAAARGGHEHERAVADLERGVRDFVITGRERSLAQYRVARSGLEGADPRVDAYIREELEPVIALARGDRRDARIAIARGGALARGEELRAETHALADARARAAVAADDRAAARADDLRLAAFAGAAAVLVLAVLCGLLLARSARRRMRPGELAARHLRIHHAVGEAIVAGGEPDTLLRELADALEAELGALYVRAGDGPFRLAAVRGLEGQSVGDELRLGEGLAGRAAAELRPVAASYDETALAVRAHGRDVAVRHELHVPLRRGPAAVGVLTLARLGGGPFDAADVELAEMVAPHAAAGLQPAEARPSVPSREVDLVRLTRESVEAARPEAEGRGVEVTLALESVPRCAGDPDRISLGLDEVVSRAMAAAGPGGRVDARLFPRAGVAVVELTVDPGSGGGLDFARAVFEDHGGAVLVEGPGGGGTAFRIEIPLHALEHA
ncbi:MAG: GAF domain-containing protein [Thermoleophilaceae bacterium]